jgi:hypothetical protein
MRIRNYQPGDESIQAEIYNSAAGALPRFKPASAEEVARRYRGQDSLASSRFYAVDGDETVGYALFDGTGRIGYPWCLTGHDDAREPLLGAVLTAMAASGHAKAWAAYRADWTAVLEFFGTHGFVVEREMVNYLAELKGLPSDPVPDGQRIEPPGRDDLPQLLEMGRGLLEVGDTGQLGAFLWENREVDADDAFVLKGTDRPEVFGMAVAITRAGYADPAALDAAMPCFRSGALGTEQQRHKRVRGMFSCVFSSDVAGRLLLAEAARRFARLGLIHVAAQVASDATKYAEFYDRYFVRQAAFPIVSRRLE